jgi:hypothetical protein
MGAAGQITAMSYCFSALFVGHAVLHHLIIQISATAFLISFLLMFFHSRRKVSIDVF